MLRLPLEVKDLFVEWLEAHAPLRAKHVLGLIRDMRGGKLNDPNFESRFSGTGPYARMIERRFTVATRKLGLARQAPPLDTSRFRVPGKGKQLSLFG
jgi:DNA repair photolyase